MSNANAFAPNFADGHAHAQAATARPQSRISLAAVHAQSEPHSHPNPNPHRVNAAACLVSRHDVQALIQHVDFQIRTGQAGQAGGRHAPPCTSDDLSAWLGTWGHMLALRRTTWPMADLTARQRAQWQTWAHAQTDSPCIAVCSTAQGDAICRGCRRSFEEIKAWPALDLVQKRLVWARLLG